MHTQYYKEYSHHLQRDMEFKVYGHAGLPFIVFPCQNGKFFDFVCEMVKLKSENEDYIIGGDALMHSGFKPKQPYNYSGFKFSDSRMILDNDSRMYYIKKNTVEE